MKCDGMTEEEKQFKKELDEMCERITIFTEDKEKALKRQAKAILKIIDDIEKEADKGEFDGSTRGDDGEPGGAYYFCWNDMLDELRKRIKCGGFI